MVGECGKGQRVLCKDWADGEEGRYINIVLECPHIPELHPCIGHYCRVHHLILTQQSPSAR